MAERLLRTSRKHSFDPDVDVDWDAEQDPDRFYLPRSSCRSTRRRCGTGSRTGSGSSCPSARCAASPRSASGRR
nr:diiron oxygenase [Actinomadura sp. J1-007]